MKKRYSNFHRARKWHRKFRNVLYDPRGVRMWLVDRYQDLYIKYYLRSTQEDGFKLDHIGDGGDRAVLAISQSNEENQHVAST